MNRIPLAIFKVTALAMSFLIMVACRQKTSEFYSFRGFVQGTTYSIIYENDGTLNNTDVRQRVEKILADFDMSLSIYRDSSTVSLINRNISDMTDPYFETVFNLSKKVWQMTDGAFDVTIAPVVGAWGFGADTMRTFSASKIDSLMQFVGMEKIDIRNGHVVKSDPRVALDFNAIAKGYSVDIVGYYFDSQDIDNYLIEIGGEIRTKGLKYGKPWRIGIDKPVDGNFTPGANLQAVITLENKSLATSGNYRKFFMENGVKYSHTIDPKTGYPVRNNLLSVTVVADNCALADAVATSCMVLGKEKAISFFNEHPELEGFMVFSDEHGEYDVWLTKGMSKMISEY